MKQLKWDSMKMVISVAGMTICLLCGCLQDKNEEKRQPEQETDQEYAESGNAGPEELETWRAAEQQEQEELPGGEDSESVFRPEPAETEEEENEPDYRTCMSGTVVEQELTREEVSTLFYAQEIPEEVFARMDGVS